jgi:hypothetical protein
MKNGRTNPTLSWQLIAAVAIHALLLPLYGPLLDHHFAERLPFHSHLYSGGSVEHEHLAHVPHSHEHSHLPGTNSLLEAGAAGVVSIPSRDLASQESLLLMLFLAAVAGFAGVLPRYQLIGPAKKLLRPVESSSILPPERPPRSRR